MLRDNDKNLVLLMAFQKLDASMTYSDSPRPLVAETVDAKGLKCPEPVMLLRNALRKVSDGTSVKLLATDPSTCRDIPAMCRFMGHKLVSEQERDAIYEFVVEARGAN